MGPTFVAQHRLFADMKLLLFFVALFATGYGFKFDLTDTLATVMKENQLGKLLENYTLSSEDVDNKYLPDNIISYELSDITINELSAEKAELTIEGEIITASIKDVKFSISARAKASVRLRYGYFAFTVNVDQNVTIYFPVKSAELKGKLDAEKNRLVLLDCSFKLGESRVTVGDMNQLVPQMVAKILKKFVDDRSEKITVCTMVEGALESIGAFDTPVNEVIKSITGYLGN